jgi:hypothetical protein
MPGTRQNGPFEYLISPVFGGSLYTGLLLMLLLVASFLFTVPKPVKIRENSPDLEGFLG